MTGSAGPVVPYGLSHSSAWSQPSVPTGVRFPHPLPPPPHLHIVHILLGVHLLSSSASVGSPGVLTPGAAGNSLLYFLL